MTTIREISIISLAEPCSVKIEKNSKGYNYEVGIHHDDMNEAVTICVAASRRLSVELV